MLAAQRTVLEAAGVFLNARNDEIHFGVGAPAELVLEAGCELRAGRFEVGRIGSFTYLGGGQTLLRGIAGIGRFSALAPNVVAGVVEHPVGFISGHDLFQGAWAGRSDALRAFCAANAAQQATARAAREAADDAPGITIGNDVWIGEGAFLRRGVTIGDGAVVGARSVVTRDVAPYAIVGGAPARTIRQRFPDDLVERLLALRWWDYGLSAMEGVDVTDPARAVDRIERNIDTGVAQPYRPETMVVTREGEVIRRPQETGPRSAA